MYACIRETGGEFFAGVFRQENRPLTFRDPPPHPAIRGWFYASNHCVWGFSPQRIFIHCPNSCALATSCGVVKHTLAAPSLRVYAGSWIRRSENAPSRHLGE